MWDKVIQILPAVERYAWVIWFVVLIILLSPTSWLAPLGIDVFLTMYRPYVGVAFLVSGVFLFGRIAGPVRRRVENWINRRQEERRRLERLSHLTTEEKALLRGYVGPQTLTLMFDWEDGVVASLEREQLLAPARPAVRLGLQSPHNLERWALVYLSEHPDLIDLDKSMVGDPDKMITLENVQVNLREQVTVALQNGHIKGYTIREYHLTTNKVWRFSEESYREWVATGMRLTPVVSGETSQEQRPPGYNQTAD